MAQKKGKASSFHSSDDELERQFYKKHQPVPNILQHKYSSYSNQALIRLVESRDHYSYREDQLLELNRELSIRIGQQNRGY